MNKIKTALGLIRPVNVHHLIVYGIDKLVLTLPYLLTLVWKH